MADLRGGGVPVQFFFIFMQFWGEITQNNRLAPPPLRLASPPLENPGSTTASPSPLTLTGGTFDRFEGHCDGQSRLYTLFACQCKVCYGDGISGVNRPQGFIRDSVSCGVTRHGLCLIQPSTERGTCFGNSGTAEVKGGGVGGAPNLFHLTVNRTQYLLREFSNRGGGGHSTCSI